MVNSFAVERQKIADLLEAVLKQHLADAGIPAVNDTYEEVFGKESIGRFPSVREMRFYIDDIAAFTPEVADRLQKQVLPAFKKWTLVGQYFKEVFTLSSRGVSFGDHGLVGSLANAADDYQEWLRAVRVDDEERRGPLRRQFRHLVPHIPTAISVVRAQRVAVLAAFDRFIQPGWDGNPVVWVLTPGGKEEPYMRPGDEQRTHPVTSEGVVELRHNSKYSPFTDLVPSYYLHAHEFPWTNRKELELVLPGWKGAPDEVIGPVVVQRLIRDSDMKNLAGPDQSG
jgi:hypothetical protein